MISQVRSSHRSIIGAGFVFGLAVLAASAGGAEEPEEPSTASRRLLYVPPMEEDLGVTTLEERRTAQIEAARDYRVLHDFRFRDELEASGIGFRHRIVDDVGKYFKPVHYDHGNGLAVADVDGDGLDDLYFTTQLGSNELWKNLGNGRFEDMTETSGTAVADRVSVAAAFADIDNDGDPDLFVTTVRMGNLLFENDGKGRFTDISEAAGVAYVGHSSAPTFLDYNNDGRLDLFVANVGRYTADRKGRGGAYVGEMDAFRRHLVPEHAEASILYENLGGNRFRDVSKERDLVDLGWSGDAAFADLNGDLYPELYVLNMQGDDHFYANLGGKRFVERAADHFPKNPWGAMGVRFFDFDNDTLLDLYLTDMHSDMPYEQKPVEEKLKTTVDQEDPHWQGAENNIFGNAFYRNLGEGRFEEISDRNGTENYWPWGFSVGDLNADGYADLFVASSMSFPYRYGLNSVLLNERGRMFRDAELVLGVEPRRDGRSRTEWFDLDCSGGDARHPQCDGREGSYTLMAALGTRSSVLTDLDDDGDLDIVTSEFNAEPQVLVSDLADRYPIRYLKVRLRGVASNRDGLGATVRVYAGGEVLTRYHDGKSGYLSQSSQALYFGLGRAPGAERIEVDWPSGVRQTVTEGLAAGSLVEIVEEVPEDEQEEPPPPDGRRLR